MSEESQYLADIRKYDPEPDVAAVDGIVKHLGIALRSRDSSLVSQSDPAERARVRDGFMKKKLALSEPDDQLDKALNDVLEQMKGDRAKSRVTVCYLLAKRYAKLDSLR